MKHHPQGYLMTVREGHPAATAAAPASEAAAPLTQAMLAGQAESEMAATSISLRPVSYTGCPQPWSKHVCSGVHGQKYTVKPPTTTTTFTYP